MKLAFLFVVLLLFSSVKAQETNQSCDSTFRILTYGRPNIIRQLAQNRVGKLYGIEFFPVAGCMVKPQLMDSVRKENENVRSLMEAKYGNDFWGRFNKEVDREQKKIGKYLDSTLIF